MSAEKEMWQAVIERALLDAAWTGEEFDKKGKQKPEVVWRDQAVAWLREGGRDFRQVCDAAGIDPAFLHNAFISGRIDMDAFKSAENSKKGKAA